MYFYIDARVYTCYNLIKIRKGDKTNANDT